MKRSKKFFVALMCLLAVMLAVPVQASAAVKISKKKITLVKGESTKLKITGTKRKVKWSSTRKSVAVVTKKGKVTAKNPGTAVIKAKVGKRTLTCKVTVKRKKSSSGKKTSAKKSSKKKSSGKKTSGSNSSGGSSQVWVTASGSKYHRSKSCSNMKNPIGMSLSEAKSAGYGPCSKCY